MPDYKYTVVRVGVHPRDAMDPERLELERVGARHVIVPYTDDPDEIINLWDDPAHKQTRSDMLEGLARRQLALVDLHPLPAATA